MNTVLMPKLGDTMDEGTILSWRKKVGDAVKKGDALAEIETEEVNIEAESLVEGVLRRILVDIGETVPVGTPIALVGAADEPLDTDAEAEAKTSGATAAAANGHAGGITTRIAESVNRIFISPIARRIAAEQQLDLTHIPGTGPGGRITRDDVEVALARRTAAAAQARESAPAATKVTQVAEDVEVVPLTTGRKTVAKRPQQSARTVSHFSMTVSADVTRLGALRASINEYAAGLPQPIGVTLSDLIVRAVALTLARVPEVNVTFDAKGERLLRHKQVNVGIAVALDRGLIVPVVRDANQRGVLDIARESRRLTDAARRGTLKSGDVQGGTFTVSNAEMFGVEEFTAIITPPEAGILAVGAATPTPVVRGGEIVVREMMKLTLTADHRALDGAVAARFLREVKALLEQPVGLLL
ncbi:MAG TPA: dihydrolipoamide acetyltransferase family protein [Ktedonobacterales bacterium]